MARFSYSPSYDSRVRVQPRMLKVQFGDGYKQSTPDGINYVAKSWELVFDIVEKTEADAIINFFKARLSVLGLEPFDWLDPENDDLKYTCESWNRVFSAFGYHQITTTFEQWFGVP